MWSVYSLLLSSCSTRTGLTSGKYIGPKQGTVYDITNTDFDDLSVSFVKFVHRKLMIRFLLAEPTILSRLYSEASSGYLEWPLRCFKNYMIFFPPKTGEIEFRLRAPKNNYFNVFYFPQSYWLRYFRNFNSVIFWIENEIASLIFTHAWKLRIRSVMQGPRSLQDGISWWR